MLDESVMHRGAALHASWALNFLMNASVAVEPGHTATAAAREEL
jgi:hypothetical protein